jgi:hypothetical protein
MMMIDYDDDDDNSNNINTNGRHSSSRGKPTLQTVQSPQQPKFQNWITI